MVKVSQWMSASLICLKMSKKMTTVYLGGNRAEIGRLFRGNRYRPLELVGVRGFEPPTPDTPCYTPSTNIIITFQCVKSVFIDFLALKTTTFTQLIKTTKTKTYRKHLYLFTSVYLGVSVPTTKPKRN